MHWVKIGVIIVLVLAFLFMGGLEGLINGVSDTVASCQNSEMFSK